jgi:hypothetical protein
LPVNVVERFERLGVAFQERIQFKLLLHVLLELERGHQQQLDGLLEPRRELLLLIRAGDGLQ